MKISSVSQTSYISFNPPTKHNNTMQAQVLLDYDAETNELLGCEILGLKKEQVEELVNAIFVGMVENSKA